MNIENLNKANELRAKIKELDEMSSNFEAAKSSFARNNVLYFRLMLRTEFGHNHEFDSKNIDMAKRLPSL